MPWGTVLFLIVWCRGDRRNILRCELPFVLPGALKDWMGLGWGRGGVCLFWIHPAGESKCKIPLLLFSLCYRYSALARSFTEEEKKMVVHRPRLSMQCLVVWSSSFLFKQVIPIKMELKEKERLLKEITDNTTTKYEILKGRLGHAKVTPF